MDRAALMATQDRHAQVTMADIAAACGVSKATVSKALTSYQFRCDIAADTVAKIRAYAESQGYRPDWRTALPGHHLTIALTFDTRWSAPFFTGVYEHLPGILSNFLAESDHDLFMVPLSSAARWRDVARTRCLDACVVMQPVPRGLDEILAKDRWRAVTFNQSSPHGLDQVIADDAGGCTAAVAHLIGLGHRKLVYLDTPAQEHDSAQLRRDAFKAACAAAGCHGIVIGQGCAPGDVADQTAQLRVTVAAGMAQVMAGSTAVVGYSYRETIAFMRAAHTAGLRIPRDCSLISCDDCEAIEQAVIPVTAVQLPIAHMAREAVRLITEDRTALQPARIVTCPETLLIRESTAAVSRG
jgi:DNA-binding LacI/PurR family transcriptional regulator